MENGSTANVGRILLVDGDAVFRLRLGKALSKRGFEVIDCGTLDEALMLVDATPVDFAVTDLRLVGGSGLDVVESLKSVQPQVRSVVLTGYGNTPTAVAAVKLGAVDYITKPSTVTEIIAVLMAPEGSRPEPPTDPISPEDARRQHIETVFQVTGGNVSKSARLLKMHRRTLQRVLKRSGKDRSQSECDNSQNRNAGAPDRHEPQNTA